MDRRVRTMGVVAAALTAVGLVAAQGMGADVKQPLPPEKQAAEDFAARHQAQGKPADKAQDAGAPESVADPPAVTGMLGAVGAPVPGEEFIATNAWAGWSDATTYVEVWAGATGGNSRAGAVLVARWRGADGRVDAGSEPELRAVPAPVGVGPLTIVRADGTELVVGDRAGRTMRFNPASQAFGAPG